MNPSPPTWYCLTTLPKHEALAAGALRREVGGEVCCPRVSCIKKTRRGPVRFTEALFPGYVFARFEIVTQLRHVLSLHGIRGIVRYGNEPVAVPERMITELREAFGETEIRELTQTDLTPGTEVVLVRGPLTDLHAIVTAYYPARERVRILLDILGRPTEIELPKKDVLAPAKKSPFCNS